MILLLNKRAGAKPDAPRSSSAGPAASTRAATKIHGSGPTEVRALDALDIDFEAGRFTAIMGPSGSGKSTLLHCLAGLDHLTDGSVHLGDIEVSSLSQAELTRLRRDHVGFVFQAFNLVPTLTVAENVTLPIDLAGRRVDRGWLAHVVDTVGLSDRLNHRPAELSGGQQQRVAVARALASRPSIVLADEPTGNLDQATGAEVLTFLRRAVDDFGQTLVMVTHDPVAASHADRIVFLADGRITDELTEPTTGAVIDRLRGPLAGPTDAGAR